MKVYIGHATSFDYQEELYKAVRSLEVGDYEIILPHEQSVLPKNTQELMTDVDLVIAEASYASTGLGIELGWAHAAGTKIICIYRADKTPSSAISAICKDVMAYENQEELQVLLRSIIR